MKLSGVRASQRGEQEKGPAIQMCLTYVGNHEREVRGESRRRGLSDKRPHEAGALSATAMPLAFTPSATGSPQRLLCRCCMI